MNQIISSNNYILFSAGIALGVVVGMLAGKYISGWVYNIILIIFIARFIYEIKTIGPLLVKKNE